MRFQGRKQKYCTVETDPGPGLARPHCASPRDAFGASFVELQARQTHHRVSNFKDEQSQPSTTHRYLRPSTRIENARYLSCWIGLRKENMEGETPGGIALESTTHIPIAQLSPELSASATRSIKAIVTLKWPYSSATGSVSFLLSEPDFRLRRTRGQVRVSFAGSSAKLVAASGIASGDEVVLSLEGVEWISGESTIVTPGRGVDFELRFTERVLLQVRHLANQKIEAC